MKKIILSVSACLFTFGVFAGAAETVSLGSLLAEMTDRDALTRYPAVGYTTRLWSSYDRASVGKDKSGWFANNDYLQYLRDETNAAGRVEHVMVDAKGPGAVVRAWATFYRVEKGGTIRLYVDGDLVFEGPLVDSISVRRENPLFAALPPDPAQGHSGYNVFLPIPYAKSCKMTVEYPPLAKGWVAFYYNVETRTYPEGTEVESFTREVCARERAAIAAAGTVLASGTSDPLPADHVRSSADAFTLEPGAERSLDLRGPGAVRKLVVDYVESPYKPEVPPLDALEIELVFDGVRTARTPATAFFCASAGREDFQTRFVASKNGVLESRWTMPYAKDARITLRNRHVRPMTVRRLAVDAGPYAWDAARSMHFHADARDYVREPTFRNGTQRDVNYLTCRGKGVLVGCGVRVMNPANGWWGEGDEKIYVDGETFPSYLGTGTEDHYGYAWCRPESFSHPFAAQPSGLGNLKPGFSANLRHRVLDAIPYRSSLVFDMELWHSHDCEVDYRTVSWHYRLHDGPALASQAALP